MSEMISQITDLGKIQMIAGDSQTFDIEILPDDESVEKSMVGYTCYFQLSPIGQEDVLVFNKACELKQGSITTFFITLVNSAEFIWQKLPKNFVGVVFFNFLLYSFKIKSRLFVITFL